MFHQVVPFPLDALKKDLKFLQKRLQSNLWLVVTPLYCPILLLELRLEITLNYHALSFFEQAIRHPADSFPLNPILPDRRKDLLRYLSVPCMNLNLQSRLTPMLYSTFLNFTVTNSMKAAPALTLVALTLLLAFAPYPRHPMMSSGLMAPIVHFDAVMLVFM